MNSNTITVSNQSKSFRADKIPSYLILPRRVVYIVLGWLSRLLPERVNSVVVLSYHAVSADAWKYSIRKEVLAEQLAYLKKHFALISMADLVEFLAGRKTFGKPACVVTFDDGYEDVLNIVDVCEQLHIKPTLFVLANRSGVNRVELANNKALLSAPQIIELHTKYGWDIGSHSSTHSNLSELTDREIEQEVAGSKQQLEQELGFAVQYFSYPRGKYTDAVVAAVVRAGYEAAVTVDDGFLKPGANPFLIPRVGLDKTHSFAEFKTTFSPLVVMLRKLIKSMLGPNAL